MSGLLQRYDLRLMIPPDPGEAAGLQEPLSTAERALQERMEAWCCAAPESRLRVARLATDLPQAPALLTQLALQLDGSLLLQSRGQIGGLGLRLRVKLQDAGLWPVSSPIWDAGCLRGVADASSLIEACRSFRPRRPTLLWIDTARQPDLEPLLASFVTASRHYQQPLRLLILDASGALTQAPEIEHID